MRTLIVLAMLAHAGVAAAQPAAAPTPARVRFGIAGGVNLATLDVNDDGEDFIENRIGLVAGGAVIVPLAPNFGLQPGVLLTQKGAEYDLSEFDIDEFSIRLTYLEIPLLLRVNATTSGQVAPYLVVGPALAFLLKAETVLDGEDEDIKETTSSFDLGLAVGGGLEIAMGGAAATIEARYTHGLINVADPPEEEDIDAEAHNRVFSFLVGVLF